MKPTEKDVIDANTWLINTIDGVMKSAGQTTWVYKKGFASKSCPPQDGHDMFQFSWDAYAKPTENPEQTVQNVAQYMNSIGLKGVKGGQYKSLWAATYNNPENRIYAQYMEGKGGSSVTVSTTCHPGTATEADKLLGDLIKRGTLHDPPNFDPNA